MTVRWYVLPYDTAAEPNSSGAYDLVLRYMRDSRHNSTGVKVFAGTIYRYEKLWCGWADVTPAEHAIISADTQTLSAPVNINNTLGDNAVTTVSNFLESIKIPAQWVNSTKTYREVIRGIVEFFSIYQMLREVLNGQSLFSAGITLDTQWQDMPQQFQTDALALWITQGFNTSGLQPTTKLRTILRGLTTQLSTRVFNLNGQIL